MKLSIPPHIAWPLFIVALLLISISAAVFTYIAANSDGGPQVVDRYYETAAVQEETARRQQATETLRLQFDVQVEAPSEAGLRVVELAITDAEGAAVIGVTGDVTALRPQRASSVATVPLTEDGAGYYRAEMPIGGAGLWDFRVDGTYEGTPFETTLRTELSR